MATQRMTAISLSICTERPQTNGKEWSTTIFVVTRLYISLYFTRLRPPSFSFAVGLHQYLTYESGTEYPLTNGNWCTSSRSEVRSTYNQFSNRNHAIHTPCPLSGRDGDSNLSPKSSNSHFITSHRPQETSESQMCPWWDSSSETSAPD